MRFFPFFSFLIRCPSNLQYILIYLNLFSILFVCHPYIYLFEYWNRREYKRSRRKAPFCQCLDLMLPVRHRALYIPIRSTWNKRRRKWQQLDVHKEDENHLIRSHLHKILEEKGMWKLQCLLFKMERWYCSLPLPWQLSYVTALFDNM